MQNKFGRKGSRFGHDTLVDGMLKDGLWDVYNDCAMGNCAELCADNHSITREDQVHNAFFFLCSFKIYTGCWFPSVDIK